MNEFVIGGLVKRRAELAGEIEATHERLRKLVTDLEALDATILQFDTSYSVETIAPKAFRPRRETNDSAWFVQASPSEYAWLWLIRFVRKRACSTSQQAASSA